MAISPTLAINEEIARRRARGLKTIALGFGEAHIPVLDELAEQLRTAAPEAAYGPVAGTPEARDAAAQYLSRRQVPTSPEQILIGPGSKPLLYALFGAIAAPVVLPKPSWVSYSAQAAMQRVEAIPVPLASPSDGGVPDPERLDAAARAAQQRHRPLRAVLVTIPDNPTGTVASPDVVAGLTEVAERWDLLIISDEIYGDLIHEGGRAVTPATLVPERSIVTTGLSKNLALGGWRLGVARFPERCQDIQREVEVAASEIWSAPPHPVQDAAAWAFSEPEAVQKRVAASRHLHGTIARAVAARFSAAGAKLPAPQAGFYLYPDFTEAEFPTSEALARYLLAEQGVATLPGSAFGDDPQNRTLRVATTMIYGESLDQRQQALGAADPASLPWIASSLDELSEALSTLARFPRRRPVPGA